MAEMTKDMYGAVGRLGNKTPEIDMESEYIISTMLTANHSMRRFSPF